MGNTTLSFGAGETIVEETQGQYLRPLLERVRQQECSSPWRNKVLSAEDVCPYVGLRPYTDAERDYFFGRERDQRVSSSNLYAASLTILYGESGVGKSSVLLAGVVPYLRSQPRSAVVVFREWQRPDFLEAIKSECLKAVELARQQPLDIAPTLPLDDLLCVSAQELGGSIPCFVHPDSGAPFDRGGDPQASGCLQRASVRRCLARPDRGRARPLNPGAGPYRVGLAGIRRSGSGADRGGDDPYRSAVLGARDDATVGGGEERPFPYAPREHPAAVGRGGADRREPPGQRYGKAGRRRAGGLLALLRPAGDALRQQDRLRRRRPDQMGRRPGIPRTGCSANPLRSPSLARRCWPRGSAAGGALRDFPRRAGAGGARLADAVHRGPGEGRGRAAPRRAPAAGRRAGPSGKAPAMAVHGTAGDPCPGTGDGRVCLGTERTGREAVPSCHR